MIDVLINALSVLLCVYWYFVARRSTSPVQACWALCIAALEAWTCAVNLWAGDFGSAVFGAAKVGFYLWLAWTIWRRRPKKKPSRALSAVRRLGSGKLAVIPVPAFCAGSSVWLIRDWYRLWGRRRWNDR